MYKKMVLLAKLEDMDAYAHKALLQFPKYERHVLCADIRHATAEAVKLTIRAGKRYYKKTTLQDLDIHIEYMKTLVRKAYNLKYISGKRCEVWSRYLREIGAMVGSWINRLDRK